MTLGQNLGKAAYETAKNMGNNKSLGKCALAVGNALSKVVGESVASKFRGNAYQWLPKLKSDLGKKYWKYLKQSKDTTNLPAGSIVLWDKQPAHPYGHIEIADGNKHLCSDFIRDDFRPLYVSNPANVIPYIFIPLDNNDKKLPYDVKVTATALNIREKADIKSKIKFTVPQGTILRVWAIETKENVIWGKNSDGYFSLQYCKQI